MSDILLSVIMPVFNEIKTIEKIIEKVSDVKIDKEIIIIDDFSKDGTREFLQRYQDDNRDNERLQIIFHDRNRGKGSAIRTGLNNARGEAVIIQDADLEYEPNDYPRLVNPISDGVAEVVYGSRILGRNDKSYLRYYWGGRFLTFVTNLLYSANITDEPTCYKAFRTKVIKEIDLRCERFEFCPEVTAKVINKGYKIKEVPISYYPRSIKEGKKIRWSDGVEAIYILFRYRFFR